MPSPYEVVQSLHDRSLFDCGELALNDYLQRYARQNTQRGAARTYVAAPNKQVLGYFTLCTSSIALKQFPESERRGLPRLVPAVHLARLAVDNSTQGQGLGEALLLGALKKAVAVAEIIGVVAVVVWCINERARSFYMRYNFQALLDDEPHLYLSLEQARQLLD